MNDVDLGAAVIQNGFVCGFFPPSFEAVMYSVLSCFVIRMLSVELKR